MMRVFLLLLLLLFAAPALAQPVGTPITVGQSFKAPSAIMGTDRVVNVWLPSDYAKGEKRYPVLYVIDGGLDQDFLHIAGLSSLGELSGMYPAMIVVGIETKDRRNELTFATTREDHVKAFPTLGGADRFRRYIGEEVIPWVRAHYRTSGESAVIGESLAGLFIVDTFLKQPDMFTRYLAISPSLWWDAMSLSARAPALLAKHDGALHSLYLTTADEGGQHQAGMDWLVAVLKKSAPAGLRWTYVARPTEKHSTIYHGAALDALRWAYGEAPKP